MMEDPITRVVLTGFMGAGKSTVGSLLASRLDWPFVDVDHVLVLEHGLAVADLFATHGEAGFRMLEAAAVERALLLEQAVIALGGGALELPSTRERLLTCPKTRIVFLETPLDVALARCAADGTVRPILAGPTDSLNSSSIKARFERRHAQYRQAHHTLLTAGRRPEELAEELRARLAPSLAARK